jgi:hypothetical protein
MERKYTLLLKYWDNNPNNMDIDMETVSPSKYIEKLKAVANHKMLLNWMIHDIQNFKDNGNITNGLVHKILINSWHYIELIVYQICDN